MTPTQPDPQPGAVASWPIRREKKSIILSHERWRCSLGSCRKPKQSCFKYLKGCLWKSRICPHRPPGRRAREPHLLYGGAGLGDTESHLIRGPRVTLARSLQDTKEMLKLLVGVWKGTRGTRGLAHCPASGASLILCFSHICSIAPRRRPLLGHKTSPPSRSLSVGWCRPGQFPSSHTTSFRTLYRVTLLLWNT